MSNKALASFNFTPSKDYGLLLKQANAMADIIRAMEAQRNVQSAALEQMQRELVLRSEEEICAQRNTNQALTAEIEMLQNNFQERAKQWMTTCFGEAITYDTTERTHRFLEEAIELAQSCGCSQGHAHALVRYVFERPVGEIYQETGGVMLTLAALSIAQGIEMTAAAESELARVWTKISEIRKKQASKPKYGPLPSELPRNSDTVVSNHQLILHLSSIVGSGILNDFDAEIVRLATYQLIEKDADIMSFIEGNNLTFCEFIDEHLKVGRYPV